MAGLAQPVFDLPGGWELRPWEVGDADVLVAAAQDPDIRHWNFLHMESREVALGRIERMRSRWQSEQGAIWALARAGGGEAVGLVGWRKVDLHEGSAEFVYWILPAARGGGVVVDAVRRLTRWGLEELGLHRLQLGHSVLNSASCRVAAKAGYALEGTQRSALLHADGWHDLHLHAFVDGDPR